MGGVLFEGGCVVSLDKRVGNLAHADVHVEDGRIAAVGPDLRVRGAERVDASGAIVVPGFVDAHRHTWRTLLRNLATSAAADPAAVAERYGRAYRPDDVYAATLVGLLSAAAAGITTVVDCADILVDDRYLDAALQAHRDAGLRTVLVQTRPRWADPDGDPPVTLRSGTDGLISFAYGAADVTTAGLDATAEAWRTARRESLRIHAHASCADEDRGAIAQLGADGSLGDDVTLTHCSHLDDADLDAVTRSGARVCLTAISEMALGLGPAPVQRLLDRSVRPALGTEDQLAGPGDVFAQMRAAQSLQHATVFERKLAGKAGLPPLLSTRDVIRFATVDGAVAAGLGETTGTLTPGRAADLVVLRADRPNIAPINDPVGAVVWGMDASNVDWVVVAGRPLVRNGVMQADVPRARDVATEARQRLERATGELIGDGSRS